MTAGGWGTQSGPNEPIVIVGPATEPVTPFEVKAQCRIDLDDYAQDQLLATYISAARDYLEWRAGMTIHEQTLEWALNYWPYSGLQNAYGGIPLTLPRATPLLEVLSVKYADSSGVETTWPADQYTMDTRAQPGSIAPAYGVAYPSFIAYPSAAVRIRYRAGIPTASPVSEAPGEVKYPILLIVAGMYEYRESEIVPDRNVAASISLRYGAEAFIERLMSRTGGYAF